MRSLALLSCLAATALGAAFPDHLLESILEKRAAGDQCLSDPAPTTTAPKTNVWAQISPADNKAVWNLLHSTSWLNLTHPSNATHTDNYVFWIDTLHTNKSAVLPYIDGTGPLPAKYARAII